MPGIRRTDRGRRAGCGDGRPNRARGLPRRQRPRGGHMNLLSLHDLTVRHGQLTAVNALSLELAEGSTLAVIGANGAGKTTLLRAIAGTLPPAGGTITFDGH